VEYNLQRRGPPPWRRDRAEPGGPMLKYSHPTLAFLAHYWPVTIFLPTILLVILTLAMITRAWDRRDEEARQLQQF
jgi:hypothetical protein